MSCKTFHEALALIAKKFGKTKLHNRSFVIACLKDLLPDQKAARKILDTAFANGVAEKFDEASGTAVNRQQMVLFQCCMQLCSDHGFQKELVEDTLWAFGIVIGFKSRPETSTTSATKQVPKPTPQPAPQPLPKPAPKPSLQPASSSPPPSSQKAIDVNEIATKYNENIVAAKTQYEGKRLRLKGTVSGVKDDHRGRIYIAIDSHYESFLDSEAYIAASQQPAVAQLRQGQTIEFMGTIQEFKYATLHIINCELL